MFLIKAVALKRVADEENVACMAGGGRAAPFATSAAGFTSMRIAGVFGAPVGDGAELIANYKGRRGRGVSLQQLECGRDDATVHASAPSAFG